MKRLTIGCALLGLLCGGPGRWASAEPICDDFRVQIGFSNHLDSGSGSGHDGGRWYLYENTDWWNQWFYSGPPDPTRWKVITYDMWVSPIEDPAHGDVAINWSTRAYGENFDSPPLPPLTAGEEDEWIERYVLFSGSLWGGQTVAGTIVIPDDNPEWVSIDVRGELMYVWGTICHESVPEPATWVLAAMAVLGLLARRRRQRSKAA